MCEQSEHLPLLLLRACVLWRMCKQFTHTMRLLLLCVHVPSRMCEQFEHWLLLLLQLLFVF